jgi:hypothetical protein
MASLRIIVISSVLPSPHSAGSLVLHRHLTALPDTEIIVHPYQPNPGSLTALIRKVVGVISRTPLRRCAEDAWAIWNGRWIDAALPPPPDDATPTVVLTVAHGDAHPAALRFATLHRLPLIAFFHDWWPDIPRAHTPFRRLLDGQFRQLASQCASALCVSTGMKHHLGDRGNQVLLYPIPDAPALRHSDPYPPQQRERLHVRYFGNLADYGTMVGDLLGEVMDHPTIELQVRGTNPPWPESFKQAARLKGSWTDFAPREEFEAWLAASDAFLIPMAFDPSMRRRMETSFPSKLIECLQYGRPIIVWGPEYCSAVKWARGGNHALCITNPHPSAVVSALNHLSSSPTDQASLARAAAAAHARHGHAAIQEQFTKILAAVSGTQPRPWNSPG